MEWICCRKGIFKIGWMVLICLALTWGCSTLPSTSKKGESQKSARKEDKNKPLYLDFDDVLIPRELKLDRDASFVFESADFSAGVLVLKARVELNSLISFFEVNMAKDNWRLISSFKSERTLLLFNKENRWCVINITDTAMDFNTRVEIWVAPTIGALESGLIK